MFPGQFPQPFGQQFSLQSHGFPGGHGAVLGSGFSSLGGMMSPQYDPFSQAPPAFPFDMSKHFVQAPTPVPEPQYVPAGTSKGINRRPWKKGQWPEGESPLEKFGYELTERAEKGRLDPCVGREDEVRRLMNILSRRTKNNPVLIGEPGVGKTAIVEGFATRVAKGDVPAALRLPIYVLDLAQIVAGAGVRGKFEERMKDLLKQVEDSDGQVILFIDEVHLALGTGRQDGPMDAANLLKPMLARGELSLIGATTIEEYRKHIEKDSAFERRLQPIFVGEPSVPVTTTILRALRPRYERHHGVEVVDGALVAAAKLAARYIAGRQNPDKAIDLIDEAAARIKVNSQGPPAKLEALFASQTSLNTEMDSLRRELSAHGYSPDRPARDEPQDVLAVRHRMHRVAGELRQVEAQLRPLTMQYENERRLLTELHDARKAVEESQVKGGEAPEHLRARLRELEATMADDDEDGAGDRLLSDRVTPSDIAEVVSNWTGIPVSRITMSERQRLLGLGAELKKRVVSQDLACERVALAILRSRAGLGTATQPIGSFLFLGPTGVGKTELARSIAYALFDDEKHMVRLDMSEYSEPHSVARMFGSPPGYVGHDAGGQLTEAVRRRPYNVILFDEIEKAHPQVLNALLQILEDGRQTDGKGRVVDFTNTVIVMTSNVGSQKLLETPVDPNAPPGDRLSESRRGVFEAMRAVFTPEFLNRIDDVVLFAPLVPADLRQIVRLMITRIAERMSDSNIELTVSDRACQFVIEQSYSAHFGARPMRRYLESYVGGELARMVVLGQLKEHYAVAIDFDGHALTFSSRPLPINDH